MNQLGGGGDLGGEALAETVGVCDNNAPTLSLGEARDPRRSVAQTIRADWEGQGTLIKKKEVGTGDNPTACFTTVLKGRSERKKRKKLRNCGLPRASGGGKPSKKLLGRGTRKRVFT